jgi:hypothetical protein
MPNDQKYALRYLLLRFLWDERNHVSPEIYKEVTKTLSVERTHEGFLVKWNRNGHQFHKHYGKNEFKFFVRGDHINTDSKEDCFDQNHNTRLSLEFVRQAFGIIQLKKEKKQKTSFPNMVLILFEYTMCAAILFLFGGKEFAIPSILIWALFMVEFWPQKGKLLLPILVAVFIALELAYTAIISALVYSVFQYLDPDREKRYIRIWMFIAIVGYGLYEVARNRIIPFYDIWLILIVITAVTIFLMRWTHGYHTRMFPLVFVFLCLGIYLDGLAAPAIAGLAYALFSNIFSRLVFFYPTKKRPI